MPIANENKFDATETVSFLALAKTRNSSFGLPGTFGRSHLSPQGTRRDPPRLFAVSNANTSISTNDDDNADFKMMQDSPILSGNELFVTNELRPE